MLGAGVFSAFSPAAEAAGAGLLLGLLLAAVIAYCNATSSARLAALYPSSGGTYVYGRERLGNFWGYLAGWSFIAGKTASCAAMALTVGHYLWPERSVGVAVAAVLAIVFLNYLGVRRSAAVTRVLVAVVVAVLAAVAAAALVGGGAELDRLTGMSDLTIRGVSQSAGFLFFAFAGYARIATLGEEVRDPERAIPRAVRIALAVVLFIYAGIAVILIAVLGPARISATAAPLSAVVSSSGASWLTPVVRGGAACAAVGALLALLLGVSRTTFAMARDRHLPTFFAAVHPRSGVPHRAEMAVGLAVVAVVLFAEVRGAIGFSSFLVLVYYAIANASALTLDAPATGHITPVLGVCGCVLIALSLPLPTVSAGVVVLLVGALLWPLTRSREVPHA
jgi:APA family basic amino acid/polyamine antiporter